MQEADSSLGLLLAGKDAEIRMLRDQLSQLSADLTRNLAVSDEQSCTWCHAITVTSSSCATCMCRCPTHHN